MFARGAMWDPSLFTYKPGLTAESTLGSSVTRTTVLQDYIKRVCCSYKPYRSGSLGSISAVSSRVPGAPQAYEAAKKGCEHLPSRPASPVSLSWMWPLFDSIVVACRRCGVEPHINR